MRFPNAALIPGGDLARLGGLGLEAAAGLNRRQKEALVDMRHGRTWSNGEYREHFGVTAEEARSELRDLVSRGLVTSTGQRRWMRYELAVKPSPWCGAGPVALGCRDNCGDDAGECSSVVARIVVGDDVGAGIVSRETSMLKRL